MLKVRPFYIPAPDGNYKSYAPQQIAIHLRRRQPNKRLHPRKNVAKANLNALEHNNANYKAINIGTEKPTTIKNLAETLAKLYNKQNLNTLTKEHLDHRPKILVIKLLTKN